MRVTADNTSITEENPLSLNCTISNEDAKGTLSATRVTRMGQRPMPTTVWTSAQSPAARVP